MNLPGSLQYLQLSHMRMDFGEENRSLPSDRERPNQIFLSLPDQKAASIHPFMSDIGRTNVETPFELVPPVQAHLVPFYLSEPSKVKLYHTWYVEKWSLSNRNLFSNPLSIKTRTDNAWTFHVGFEGDLQRCAARSPSECEPIGDDSLRCVIWSINVPQYSISMICSIDFIRLNKIWLFLFC